MMTGSASISPQDEAALIAEFRDLLGKGYYQRANDPLTKIWAAGGVDALQPHYEQSMRDYEANPADIANLRAAAFIADHLSMDIWKAAVDRMLVELPDDSLTEWLAAMYVLNTGDKAEAKTHYDRMLELDPQNPDVRSLYASVVGLDWGLKEDALHLIQQVLDEFPDVAAFYSVRGSILAEGFGDHAAALKDYDRMVLLSPDYYPYYNLRASAHIALGDHAAAIADLEVALRSNPNSPFGRFTLFQSYLETGDLRGAAGALFAPRSKLFERGDLEFGVPKRITMNDLRSYAVTFRGSSGDRVTITADTDDVKLVSPFIAIADPNGVLVTHSTIYPSPIEMPAPRETVQFTLESGGDYRLIVMQNLSTRIGLGEGDILLTLSRDAG